MSTKPSSRRRLRLILGAVAVLIPLAAMVVGHLIPIVGDRVVMSAKPRMAEEAGITPAARQAGVDESWWQAVSAEIGREEYATQSTAQGLQAPNRAQNLRTTFGERGIEVLPRVQKDTAPAWRFAWQTTGFGRPGQIEEVSPSSPSSVGARVVYQRNGWSEWYENTMKGLEQGFMIERRPAGEGPLAIAGTFPASLHPRTREDGAVDFLDEHEACVIRYGELHVFDAKGADVPAELVVAGSTLAIQIDDQDAHYPLTVDPLMTSPAWTAEGDQIAANFGFSVATAGDVNSDGFSDVIVGAPGYDNGQEDEGRAYVFLGSAAGLATTPAWTAETNQAFGGFGQSVGAAGDVNGDGFDDVVVGAMFVLNGPNVQGAFVYHGSDSGLAASPAWIAENAQTDAFFGWSVGTAGDVNGDGFDDVIVGAPDFDNGETNEGRAFVYQGSAAGLSTSPAWTAESNQASASFGYSVSTAGDVNADGFDDVIVGAWAYDNNSQPNQGRAFVYRGSAAGLSTTAAWTGESGQQGSNFGWSVANAGDLNGDGYADVIVGAPRYGNGQSWEGRAYAYHGSAAGLGSSPAWSTESGQVGAELGNAVATAGDVNGDGFSDVIIGAKLFDNGQNNEGRALVFLGSATGLATLATWFSEVDQGAYGGAVGSAGDVNGDGYSDVIVGAPNYGNGQAAEGRAFVYHGAAAGLANVPAWITESNQIEAHFGSSVTTAGDVNGDGFSDVIVGAPDFDNGETNEGRAFVFQGSAAGLSQTPAWTAESNLIDAHFGSSVATAGDVNGDGFSDVIVGAPDFDNGETKEGRAFVFQGSAAGLAQTPAWTAESNQIEAQFGYSVATAGDVNGDGFSDVIAGAWQFDNGEVNEGRAFVYQGSASGLAPTPAWTAESNQIEAYFGESVATAGDVNSDGFSDAVVGASGFDNGQTNEGKAFLYQGSVAGLAANPAWTAESNRAGALFGGSVSAAGDVNGDGFSDLIVGAWKYTHSTTFEGRAFLYLGSASGLAPLHAWAAQANLLSAAFGYSVSTAGDVNGDGFSDVIVGAFNYGDTHNDEGSAFLYGGSAVGLPLLPDWIADSNQVSAFFGTSVSAAGDVNGDGFSDVIIGAPAYDNGHMNEGRVYVYYGNSGDGLDRSPRQARTDDAAPIWLLGSSDSESAFRLKALGRTAAGRGDVRLQFEVKPAGVPFNGTGLVTGSVSDTGAPSSAGSAVTLSQLANGLVPETLYHWRLRVASDSPFFPRSPWMWLPYNAATEADVRTKEATIAVGSEEPHPAANLWLAPGAPNPFNPRTTLSFLLPARTPVRLAIHDVQGRLVRLLVDEVLPAGQHAVEWDGHDGRGQELATGVYMSRLEAGGEVRSRKLALVK